MSIGYSKFKRQIEGDIKFILRDYPFKKIFKGDIELIKKLLGCKVACFSHKKKNVKGLSMYSHFQRKEIREVLSNYTEEFLSKYLNDRGIQIVDYGYKKIRKKAKQGVE